MYVTSGQDPALSTCLHNATTAKTGRKGVGGKTGYPDCMYSKVQLDAMLIVLGDWMAAHGYTVSEACKRVLNGVAPGGVDAKPVNPFAAADGD